MLTNKSFLLKTEMNQKSNLLLGKIVSSDITQKLSSSIKDLKNKNIIPKLAAILVGDNPASKIYIKNKTKFFVKNGCESETFNFSSDSNQSEIISCIQQLNNDDSIHGILVQLPLPKSFDDSIILETITPKKDVDGFHPYNVGKLFSGNPQFIPCTPHGIIKILDYYKINTSGKNCVVIGRSNIVGKPMFALLSQKFETGNATVTMCHSRTNNLRHHTLNADIVVCAIGVPNFLKGNMIKKGSVIIDVGINRIVENSAKKGYKIVGDVDFESVINIASHLTPVPGGVGPMTIAMLLYNTVSSAKLNNT